MARDLIINYDNKPCYSICFRPDFEDLLSVFNTNVNKKYDSICIVTDSNVSKFYLGAVFSVGIEWLGSKDKYTKEQILAYLEELLPDVM